MRIKYKMPKIEMRMRIWMKHSKQASLLYTLKYALKEKIVVKMSVKNDRIDILMPNPINLTR